MLHKAAATVMVGVAQLAERQVVVLDAGGSSPLAHPKGYRQNCRCRTDRTVSVTVSYCACEVRRRVWLPWAWLYRM